jgi:hypothetical protein
MDIKFKDVIKGAVRGAGLMLVVGTSMYVGSKLGKGINKAIDKAFSDNNKK